MNYFKMNGGVTLLIFISFVHQNHHALDQEQIVKFLYYYLCEYNEQYILTIIFLTSNVRTDELSTLCLIICF